MKSLFPKLFVTMARSEFYGHSLPQGLSKKVQEVNNKQYASEGLSRGMATSDLFLAENRQKATVANLSGEKIPFFL